MVISEKQKLIKAAQPCVGQEEVEAVRKVLLSGNYISGKKVKEFEGKFADYVGVKYAIACNSGTSALHIILAALGIGPGDEVLVPSLTFFSTISAVLHQNAVPVFVDIDLDDFCISPQDVIKRITDKTKAMIPVHLFGDAAKLDELIEIANKHNLNIVEDCAQAHGTEYNNKKVGSFGMANAFSFFATKHMTTGEGGMITTDNEEIKRKAGLIRSHGLIDRDNHILLGYNYRMTEMAAAMGIVQLTKLDYLNQKRIENSLYLINSLKELNWAVIPQLNIVIKHTFFWCPIWIDEGKLGFSTRELIGILRKKGIEVRQRYQEPLYRQRILLDRKVFPKDCPLSCPISNTKVDYSKIYMPNAEKIAGKVIGLPNHPDLSKDELDYIVKVLKEVKNDN